MTPLRVVSVRVRDVLGAVERNLEPGGKLTVISGPNGSGKSTILASIQAALAGGSLAKLQRVGAEGEAVEPEVVLVIDGPGHERYQIERGPEKVRVRRRVGDTAAFEDVPQPQAFLSSLFDPTGANPVRFLTAADKDRALLLLEALDLDFDRAALLAEMKYDAADLPAYPAGLNPLEEIATIRAAVFDRRQDVNRDRKNASGTADQLRREIPAELPADPAAEIKAIDADVSKLAADLAAGEEKAAGDERAHVAKALADVEAEADRIAAEFNAFKRDRRAAHDKQAAKLRAEVERAIATELATVEKEIEERKDQDEAALRALDAKEATARRVAEETRRLADEALAALRNTLEAKRQQLAVLREQEKHATTAKALTAQAAKFEKDAERLTTESERLTSSIEILDAFRRRMAENLPIPGLSIEGKVIRVNGVPFDQLNMQQRIDIAVQVAVMRSKNQRLPVLFVDGAEALDHAHFEALAARLAKEGVQAFVARVDDAEFTVTKDAVPA
jgi:energy-coupling factor transporter ATP-binding protein EcfA2